MTPLRPDGSTVELHWNPGSGTSATRTELAFTLDVHVALRARAVCVQHVSCANDTMGAAPDAEAPGVALADTPSTPPPPRNRKPPTAVANTSATTTTIPCAIRSPRVYMCRHMLASRGPASDSPPAPAARRRARACARVEERDEPRARALGRGEGEVSDRYRSARPRGR